MAYIHPKTAGMLYLTADKSEVVSEDSPLSAFVLVAPGGTLSDAEAARWGLVEEEEPEPESKSKEEPAANKLAAPAAQNKRKGKGA